MKVEVCLSSMPVRGTINADLFLSGVHKGHNFAALSALSHCTGLKSLFVDCTVGWLREPRNLARQIFRDGHYFLERFGAANGKFDAAIDILQFDEDWQFNKHATARYARPSDPQEREADPGKRAEFDDELRSLLSRRK